MDKYDIFDAEKPPQKKRPAGLVWNVLTVFVLIAIICVITVFLQIYLNPNSILNPFPPPTVNPASLTPTPTLTLRFIIVPSWTPTLSPPQATETPVSTSTPPVTPTIAPQVVLEEEPSAVPTSADYAFVLQDGNPSAIDGTQFHPDIGCNWMGVAGQATSLNGESVKGLFVQLGGTVPGVASTDSLVMTGMSPSYGPGGFEFTLSNKPVATSGTLWVQLLDQQSLPLSDRVYFDTYDNCEKNLVIIYFNQVR